GLADAHRVRQDRLKYWLQLARRRLRKMLPSLSELAPVFFEFLFQFGVGIANGINASPRLRCLRTKTGNASSALRPFASHGRIEPKPINPNRTARRTRGVSLDHLVGVARALAIRRTDFMEYRRRAEHYSALMLADLITLPHFSVSSAMSLPKSAGVNA